MPSAVSPPPLTSRITRFTNCRLVRDNSLISEDLWIDNLTGKILHSQSAFYGEHLAPDQTIDLQNRILAPGFIDVQINGAQGFDFSVYQEEPESYKAGVCRVNHHLIREGVTSYLPTVTSQKESVYHAVLPHLGPSGSARDPWAGTESLGAHVEGPYMSPCRNGIHKKSVLLKPSETDPLASLTATYGASNLFPQPSVKSPDTLSLLPPNIKMVTTAPELYTPDALSNLITALRSNGQIFSVGHTDADYATAGAAVAAGANMITHLFNAMRPFNHRDPGVFGLLANPSSSSPSATKSSSKLSSLSSSSSAASTRRSSASLSSLSSTSHSTSSTSSPPSRTLSRPFYGLIADSIHLSPAALSLAHSAHSNGTILVTDAMPLSGLADGIYPWTNGEYIVKRGRLLTLADAEGNEDGGDGGGRIAGSTVSLVDCVNEFRRATGVGVAEAVAGCTLHPALMLGNEQKGVLEPGRDADLVVLDVDDEGLDEGGVGDVKVVEVWKFGVKVFQRGGKEKSQELERKGEHAR